MDYHLICGLLLEKHDRILMKLHKYMDRILGAVSTKDVKIGTATGFNLLGKNL